MRLKDLVLTSRVYGGWLGERGVKKAKKKKNRDSSGEGDARLRRVTEMAADGAAFEMEIKRVI